MTKNPTNKQLAQVTEKVREGEDCERGVLRGRSGDRAHELSQIAGFCVGVCSTSDPIRGSP